MSVKTRFRYPLEPLRLTREWALRDAQFMLAEQNGRLVTKERELQALESRAAAAAQAWGGLASDGQPFFASQQQVHARFMADLLLQADTARAELAAMQEVQQKLASAAADAQRALDAVDEHREGALQEFRRAGNRQDFKDTDEMWAIRGPGRGEGAGQ